MHNAELLLKQTGDVSNTSIMMPVCPHCLFNMQAVQCRAANPNSEISYAAAHGTVSVLNQACKERREGGIKFTSPEIRHTGQALLVGPPPAGLLLRSSFTVTETLRRSLSEL